MTAPMMPQQAPQPGGMPGAPQAPQPPPPFDMPPPFLPFTARPNDTEPAISAIWMRRLSRVMSSVKYTQHGPEWKDVLDQQYLTCRQAAATASAGQGTPQGQPQKPAKPQPNQPPGGAANVHV